MSKFDISLGKDIPNIIGIGMNPFDRMGPEKLIPKYRILTVKKYELCKLLDSLKINIDTLDEIEPNFVMDKYNTENLIQSEAFIEYKKQFNNTAFLIYKTNNNLHNIAQKLGIKLIANDPTLCETIENKSKFREIFSKKINIPPYSILKKKNILDESIYKPIYTDLSNLYNKLVVQDDLLSGGKGTFFVDSFDKFKHTLEFLSKEKGENIIISKFIEGEVTSLQCCVTRYGTFSTGFQEQIIASPDLMNPNFEGTEKFNGGQWGYTSFAPSIIEKGENLIKKIGNELFNMGYRGIFGIDTIITPNNELFTIEINARLTGMTPMITFLQNNNNEIPLLLLHILELLNLPYNIDNTSISKYFTKPRFGGYLILHNKKTFPIGLKQNLKSGIYELSNFKYIKKDLYPKKNQVLIILDPPKKNENYGSGDRILRIISLDKMISNNTIFPKYKKIIRTIEENYLES